MKFGSIEIIDNNGWNLNEVIPEWDWKVEESNLKIPPEFGVGIKTRYNGEVLHLNMFLMKHRL